jgi:uncharacterized protein
MTVREDLEQPSAPLVWNGKQSIWQAAAAGDMAALEAFVANGLDVDVADNEDRRPLIYAAEAGQNSAVSFLLGRGADVNATDLYGTSPLMAAASAGKSDTVNLLLNRGADAEAKVGPLSGYAGDSASELAARNGHTDVVTILKRAKRSDGEFA